MSVRAYWAHCRIQIREDMRYFWSDAFWNGALTAFFALLLILFYDAAGTIEFGGLTWAMLVWYIFAVQFSSGPASMFVRTVTLQVNSGEIITRMSRPSNYALASFWEHVGTIIPSSLARLLFIIPIAGMIAGFAILSPLSVVAFLVCCALAIVLDYVISLCIGLIAFWTEDARPYRWVYSKIIFIIGGTFFPLDIYPEAIRNVVKWLPPAFLAYHPAMALVKPTTEGIITAIFGAVAWIGIFAIIASIVWRAAVKRVEVNGG